MPLVAQVLKQHKACAKTKQKAVRVQLVNLPISAVVLFLGIKSRAQGVSWSKYNRSPS